MKTLACLTAVSAVALFAALPATAAGLVTSAEPVVAQPTAEWSGVYIGGQLGYGLAGLVEADDPEYGYDLSGFLAGVQLGARQQTGNFVLGAQADIAWSGQTGSYHWDDGTTFDNDTVSITWQGSLTGRGGVVVDNTLLYGLAGVTAAAISADYQGDVTTTTAFGATLGAGAEFKISDNVSVFGEYAFTQFANFNAEASDPGSEYWLGGSSHAVKVGLNYSF